MNALVDQSAQSAVMAAGADPFGMGAENSGQTTYVKFKGASGQYLAGQDEDEIEHGTEYAADIFNAQWLWTFWWDGKVIETVDALLREEPLLNKHMPDHLPEDEDGDIDMTLEEIIHMQKTDPANFRDGWSVQASFNMLPLDGSGEEFTMRLGGMVSLNAFDALRKAYSRRYKIEAGKLPIISLDVNKYKSKVKGVGTRYAPVMKIGRWATEDEMIASTGENPADYDDDVPPQEEPKAIESDAKTEDAPAPRRRGARGRNMG